jgi:hypothetical protein
MLHWKSAAPVTDIRCICRQVLIRSGTEKEKWHAQRIIPLVKKQHLLLVTLLLCNAAAMEVTYNMLQDADELSLCSFGTAASVLALLQA